ncbi:hypothetical protein I5Q34_08955 [Streptomyces sp. AV19]|uniref:hypothetical protein n=1 Tax=Streptomyces sp. AV19 TaxID=2793068 RepID=UPI0018FEF8C0|nr:hypothetical protein [Streptomyces sp. AV19]MBH1934415.1 hypothetical protein [Streptomyces sp. AV19]MDG4536269.1 hypothetical protein [Streptomyces sp. AV19]
MARLLRAGDLVIPQPLIVPSGTLIPVPTPLPGSAGFLVEHQPACVPDDIEQLRIYLSYSTPAYPVFGAGEARLRLTPAHRSRHARTNHGTEVVLDGGPLELVFTPMLPASNPAGQTDPSTEYTGKAVLVLPPTRAVLAGSQG